MSPEPIRHATAATALGDVLLALRGSRLVFTSLRGSEARLRLERFVERAFPGTGLEEDEAALARHVGAMIEYGAGERRVFDFELELVGSRFERSVWAELVRIPYGATCTYGEVAARVGASGASRAVGRANGRNPMPIVVPCHRVVAANGLGGFTGGLDHKLRLLDLERSFAGTGQGLLFH